MRHWFDGFAMLHHFGISSGDVSYANRFLQTRAYRAAEAKGEIVYSEFGTDPCRSLFGRVFSLFSPKISDNANVNLTKLGERYISMTETPIPVEFDAETLETIGVAYKPPGLLTTAHPHLDRASGGMLNYAAKVGPRNRYRFFLLPPGERTPRVIGEMPVKEPAYMHSFGLTERWLVLAEFPFVVNPISIPLSGRPYIENYRWKPELGTRFTLVDRSNGEASGPFETDACFCFHHVNSYEENGAVMVNSSTGPSIRSPGPPIAATCSATTSTKTTLCPARTR
jgi:beta,beta-carotene 9',10'-dioxygenase